MKPEKLLLTEHKRNRARPGEGSGRDMSLGTIRLNTARFWPGLLLGQSGPRRGIKKRWKTFSFEAGKRLSAA